MKCKSIQSLKSEFSICKSDIGILEQLIVGLVINTKF